MPSNQNTPSLSRIAIYTRDMTKLAAFYQTHFEFEIGIDEEGYIELNQPGGLRNIILLQASKGRRIGQSCIKLVFDVQDVEKFKKTAAKRGLKFGASHDGGGYHYSNARDPSKNLVQLSDRRYHK